MYRRFVLIFISSIPTNTPQITATMLTLMTGVVIAIHFMLQPFQESVANHLESFCLFMAFCISTFNILSDQPAAWDYLIATCALLPLIWIVPLFIWFIDEKIPNLAVKIKYFWKYYRQTGSLNLARQMVKTTFES